MEKFKQIKSFIKKAEFSKLLCGIIAAVIGVVSVYAICRYYALTKLAIETNSAVAPDATLAVTCVSVLLGSFLTYCFYQFSLKNSRNKYGIDKQGQPYLETMLNQLEQNGYTVTKNNTYEEAQQNVEDFSKFT